jgi:molecular chaperone GrpE
MNNQNQTESQKDESENINESCCDNINFEIEELKVQLEEKTRHLEEKTRQSEEYLNALQRSAAEFDNFKKRTIKEKEALYSEAFSDAVSAFLPVVDNMERAAAVISKEENPAICEGIELVFKQFKNVFNGLGVEEIKSVGEKFDPLLHNAVMHVEDENFSENEIIEEFQKGYMLKDRVIRHSMVKVAN